MRQRRQLQGGLRLPGEQVRSEAGVHHRPELPRRVDLHRGQATHTLAANLRRAFSGIVAGNVKEEAMRLIEQSGPFEIHGDPDIMQALDALLRAFVDQRRMKMVGEYRPCYRVVA